MKILERRDPPIEKPVTYTLKCRSCSSVLRAEEADVQKSPMLRGEGTHRYIVCPVCGTENTLSTWCATFVEPDD